MDVSGKQMAGRGGYTGGSTLIGRGSGWFSRGGDEGRVDLTPAQIENNRRRLERIAEREKYGPPEGGDEVGPNWARNRRRKARKSKG